MNSPRDALEAFRNFTKCMFGQKKIFVMVRHGSKHECTFFAVSFAVFVVRIVEVFGTPPTSDHYMAVANWSMMEAADYQRHDKKNRCL